MEPYWRTGGNESWTLSERAYEGSYSTMSPNLEEVSATQLRSSVAMLTICDGFEGGELSFQVIASVLPPHDTFVIYVDGVPAAQIVDANQWTHVGLAIGEGKHAVHFYYEYNPLGLEVLPPSPPQREGTWACVCL